MPELPEVEIVRQNLDDWWTGHAADQVVVHDEKLLQNVDPETVVDALRREMVEPWRRGKYLVAKFDDDSALVFHFRMTGKIIRVDEPDIEYARMAWHVPDTGWLVFKDPRRLGQVEYLAPGELDSYEPFERMGPEPYDVTGADLREFFSDRRMLKSAMLDQDTIAGLGNIAVSEILWRMKLPPRAKGGDLDDDQFDQLAETIVDFLDHVIAVETSDEVTYLAEDAQANPFDVYRHDGEPCPRCGTAIEVTRVSGRSSYFCPECQSG